MRFRASDALTLTCLLAAFGAMLLAFRGDAERGACLFLVAFAADGLHALLAPEPGSHRFGAELVEVVELIAFSVAPGLFLYLAYASTHELLAAVLGGVPVATGAVRLAVRAVRPRGTPLVAEGLPRALSALLAIGLCRSSLFEEEAVRDVAVVVLPLVALLNIARLSFLRPFARPVSWPRALVLIFAAASTVIAFLLGRGFDAVFAWAAAGLALAAAFGVRPSAAPARGA
jgi:phosphatidylserine synthase